MQINNVGPISDATILPKPLTILIGEQPAVKTAVMYALAALVDWLVLVERLGRSIEDIA